MISFDIAGNILLTTYNVFNIGSTTAKLAKVYEFKFIQMGTDCVYAGNGGDYKESSFQDAEDVYGKTRIGGEAENNTKYMIRGSIVGPENGKDKSILKVCLNHEELK